VYLKFPFIVYNGINGGYDFSDCLIKFIGSKAAVPEGLGPQRNEWGR
jgi:hypothetical protein